MSTYFIKDYYWILEEGMDGVEIFNVTDSKKMVHLNKKEAFIFKKLVMGEKIEKFEKTEELENVISIIRENKMGIFSENYYFNGNYREGSFKKGVFDDNMSIQRVFIEIDSCCDLCNNCGRMLSAPCFSCHKTQNNMNKIDKREYYKLIDKIKEYNCRSVILHGGNILREMLTYELIKYLSQKDIVGNLVLHYNMLNVRDVSKIMEKNKEKIKFIVNFDILQKEAIEKVYNDILSLKEKYGINKDICAISLRVEKKLCIYIPKIKNKINDLGWLIENVSVYSDSKISENELKAIYQIPYHIYSINRAFKNRNLCMAGTLAIDTNMNMSSCPHLGVNFMNVKDMDKENSMSEFWKLTTSKIDNCKNCSKRNRCLDCRAIESKVTNNLYGKRECEYYINNK